MKILALCAAAALTVAPLAAVAGPFEATTTVRTSSHGLDLSSERGAQVMLTRLDDAALRACGASSFSVREVRDETRRSDCYRDSMSAAVANLNAPAVRALYARQDAVRFAAN